MEPNHHAAIKLLGTYTAGRYDIWALAGPGKRSCRKHIMEVFHGRKVKANEIGVTAIRDAFYEACKIAGDCGAVCEDNFIRFCQNSGGAA